MDYLALPNVMCVGGSWIAKPKDIREKQWREIEKLAREASALV
jgi:2-dehydro-3-deoxyphosphogluconate aldolase/(4S)-4-hydroxy-2-oxoglutarate aldolase